MNTHVTQEAVRRAAHAPPRVLVAIASYGSTNDLYLERVVKEYRSMAFAVDIVVLSNLDKRASLGTDCIVGLPSKNPWSLPFAHKKLFAERCDQYDLFIYSEDDILVTERNIRAWLEVTPFMSGNEIAGFLRVEFGKDGRRNYPDVHAHFHWDPSSVRRRGDCVLAHFTNEHAACFVLTREQLRNALRSGGFDVVPHEGKYDLACTAATDPYTQCGLTKLVPISRLEDFTVHHLSNRYIGQMGVGAEELRRQTDALMQVAEGMYDACSLLPTETRLRHAAFSKDYYEPAADEIVSLVPTAARSVLSVGCGSGGTEKRLQAGGLRVVAIPLDPVIVAGPAANGIEMIYGDMNGAERRHRQAYDCVICLNLLHLARDPQKLLQQLRWFMHERSVAVIQMPNMRSPRAFRSYLRAARQSKRSSKYQVFGVHFASARQLRRWCAAAGLHVDKVLGIPARRGDGLFGMTSVLAGIMPRALSLPLAESIVVIASKAGKDGRAVEPQVPGSD